MLKIDPVTYVGTPVLPLTSSAAARAWVHRLGPVSGGTPAVELPSTASSLHWVTKLFKKKGRRTGNSHMMYKHFWYAFANMPPFALLGASLPFTLPTQLDETPSIQFATGLIYRQNTHELSVIWRAGLSCDDCALPARIHTRGDIEQATRGDANTLTYRARCSR